MNNQNFPLNTYQQAYINNVPQANFGQMPQANNSTYPEYGTLFAKGIDGAKQYPLGPNRTAIIFDSTPNTNVFYLKDTTGNGKPLRVFDYTEREEIDEAKELDGLKKEFEGLKATVSSLETTVASLVGPLQELLGPASVRKDENHG